MNWAGNTMADLCEADVHRTDRLAEYRVGDQIIQRDSNIRVIYILKDHLGSCGHKVLENNGLWRYEETTPFGQTVMSGYRLNTQQKKFVGKEQDESGLYYYSARYYDSWQCRFVTVDPLWRQNSHEGGYVYAGDNPIMFTDPMGMSKEGAGKAPSGTSRVNGLDKAGSTKKLSVDVENHFGPGYYDVNLNYLGTGEGVGDDRFVIRNNKEIRQLRQGRSLSVSNLTDPIKLPKSSVISVMNEAVERTQRPVVDPDNDPQGRTSEQLIEQGIDPYGNFHEEGGIYGISNDGQEVAFLAKSGKYADEAAGEGAKVKVMALENPDDVNQLNWDDGNIGTFHTHPRGEFGGLYDPSNNTLGTSFGSGGTGLSKFQGPPSPPDLANAASRYSYAKMNHYVLSLVDNTAYVYKASSSERAEVIAELPLKKFLKFR